MKKSISEEQLKLDKEIELLDIEIENKKIELKYRKLTWSLRNPEFVGKIVVPIAIAFTAFLSAYLTGFFDTQKRKLHEDVNNLQNDTTDLRISINGLYEDKTKLNLSNDSLRVENYNLLYKNNSLENSNRTANENLNFVNSEIRYLKKSFNEEKENLKDSLNSSIPAKILISNFSKSVPKYLNHPDFITIMNLLNNDKERIFYASVLMNMNTLDDEITASYLYYALYYTTKDTIWFTRILENIKKFPENENFMNIFGSHNKFGDEEIKIIFPILVSQLYQIEDFRSTGPILNAIYYLNPNDPCLFIQDLRDRYLDLIQFLSNGLIKVTLKNIEYLGFNPNLILKDLYKFNRYAYYATISEIVIDSSFNKTFLNLGQHPVLNSEYLKEFFIPYSPIKSRVPINCTRSPTIQTLDDVESWKIWRNDNIDLIDLWKEQKLKTLREMEFIEKRPVCYCFPES